MEIQNTENPNVIKFVTDRTLISGSLELDRNSNISNVPLAQELFQYPFVKSIFITANFIAVAKENIVEWDLVADNLRNMILESLDDFPEIIYSEESTAPIFYSEKTPNPSVVKFVSEHQLIDGFLELKSLQEAEKVPLVKKLFEEFPFVKEVFINDNFISITKTDDVSWEEITQKILDFLSDFIKNEKSVSKIEGVQQNASKSVANKQFTETEEKINAILQEYVTPAIENDGGRISLIEFDEETKTAKMLLQGACSGCPSSVVTLKNGIESILKNFLPNVVENVEAVNG